MYMKSKWKTFSCILKKQHCDSNTNILVVGELFSDGGEVHGLLDDLPVSRDGFVVDRCEEGPSVLVGLQLSQQHSGENKWQTKAIVLYLYDRSSSKKNDIFLTVRRGRVNVLRMQWVCVHAYRHTASPYVLLSFAVLAFFAGLSCLAWELGELSSPFLFLNSLVPFFGTLLLLAASSLMSSPTADGLLFRLTSLPFLPPPAVRLCCFLLRGEWPLSWRSTQKKRTKHIIFKSISLNVYMWYSYVHHLTTTWDEAPLDLL